MPEQLQWLRVERAGVAGDTRVDGSCGVTGQQQRETDSCRGHPGGSGRSSAKETSPPAGQIDKDERDAFNPFMVPKLQNVAVYKAGSFQGVISRSHFKSSNPCSV